PVVVEGKIGHEQNPNQLRRYVRRVRKEYKRRPELTVVDDGCAAAQGDLPEFRKLKQEVALIRFVTWTDVAKVCERITESKRTIQEDRIAASVAEDFRNHLVENHMTNEPKTEVYLRDMS